MNNLYAQLSQSEPDVEFAQYFEDNKPNKAQNFYWKFAQDQTPYNIRCLGLNITKRSMALYVLKMGRLCKEQGIKIGLDFLRDCTAHIIYRISIEGATLEELGLERYQTNVTLTKEIEQTYA